MSVCVSRLIRHPASSSEYAARGPRTPPDAPSRAGLGVRRDLPVARHGVPDAKPVPSAGALNPVWLGILALLITGCYPYEDSANWGSPVWSSDGAQVLVARQFAEVQHDTWWGVRRSRNHAFELHLVAMDRFTPDAGGNPRYDIHGQEGGVPLIAAPGGEPIRFEGNLHYALYLMAIPNGDAYAVYLGRLLETGTRVFERLRVDPVTGVTRRDTIRRAQSGDHEACSTSSVSGVKVVPSRDGAVVAILENTADCRTALTFLDDALSPLVPTERFELGDDSDQGQRGFFTYGWSQRDVEPRLFFVGFEGFGDAVETYGRSFRVDADLTIEASMSAAWSDAFPKGCLSPRTSSARIRDDGRELLVTDALVAQDWGATLGVCPDE